VRKFEEPRDFAIPRVADRINLPERINAIRLGDPFENRGALLRRDSRRQDEKSAAG
jgi:hypothetical protein